jgi:hypothetical protein
MDENVASAGAYPSEAVHRHLGIGNELFGRLDDQRAELAACAIVDQKARRTVGLDTRSINRCNCSGAIGSSL